MFGRIFVLVMVSCAHLLSANIKRQPNADNPSMHHLDKDVVGHHSQTHRRARRHHGNKFQQALDHLDPKLGDRFDDALSHINNELDNKAHGVKIANLGYKFHEALNDVEHNFGSEFYKSLSHVDNKLNHKPYGGQGDKPYGETTYTKNDGVHYKTNDEAPYTANDGEHDTPNGGAHYTKDVAPVYAANADSNHSPYSSESLGTFDHILPI